jgi:glycosyltransferase involved in cell wall biosynthesis
LVKAKDIVVPRLPTLVGRAVSASLRLAGRVAQLRLIRRRKGIGTTVSLLSVPNLINALTPGGRRIVCERNDPSQKPKRYKRMIGLSCRLADYATFQTERVRGLFPDSIRAKSCIVPNPVDVGCLASPSPSKKVVAVGRLHAQKNYGLLLDAFAAFRTSHPEHALHIFGIGSQLDELRQRADSLGIAPHVHFEGFSSDVHRSIADAQMYVMSSDYEGMPNALLEAMMMGLPCISTSCTGADELISSGESGILVPVGDVAALADAMARLADDAGLRVRLAQAAQLTALDFSATDVVRKWERIL